MNKKPHHLAIAVTVASCALLTGSPAVFADSYRIDAPTEGVEIGLGWDSRRNRLVPSRCITFAPVQEGGQHSTLEMSEISDSAELQSHLDVSASAQIHGLVGSGSASATFVQNTNVKTSSMNFAIRASVTNGIMFIGPKKPPALRRYAFSATTPVPIPEPVTPDPPTMANQTVGLAPWLQTANAMPKDTKSVAAFRKYCGDGFVSAIYSGVELFTVISIENKEAAISDNLAAEVSASYGIGAGQASYKQATEDKFQSANTRMHFLQRGGAGGVLPAGRQELAQKLQEIAAEASAAPEFFDIEVTPYSDLPSWPQGLDPLTPETSYADLMVERYLQLRTLYRDLNDVIDDDQSTRTSTSTSASTKTTKRYSQCFSVAIYEDLQDRVAEAIALLERTQLLVLKNDWTEQSKNFYLTQFEQLQIDTPPELVASLYAGPQNPQGVEFDSQRKNNVDANDIVEWLNGHLSVPYLRTLLPPLSDKNQDCTSKKLEYQKAVIAQYIRPGSERACAESISDRNCLSNAALDILRQEVNYPSTTAIQVGASGALCISGATPVRRCLAWLNGHKDLMLTEDIDRAAIVTIENAGDQRKGYVRLSVAASRSETDEFPTQVYKRGALSKHDGIHYIGQGSGKEILWKIVPKPGATTSMFLADTTGTYKKKSGTDCLLWEPGIDSALVFPNNCGPTGRNIPNYTWVLYGDSQ